MSYKPSLWASLRQREAWLLYAVPVLLTAWLSFILLSPSTISVQRRDATIQFSAEPAWVWGVGYCTRLQWSVEHIESVYLDGGGVNGQGTSEFCLQSNEEMPILSVHFQNGSEHDYSLHVYTLSHHPLLGWIILGLILDVSVIGLLISQKTYAVAAKYNRLLGLLALIIVLIFVALGVFALSRHLSFSLTLWGLTFIDLWMFSLIGGALFDAEKQARLGLFIPAFGLLIGYLISLIGAAWFPPSWVLVSLVVLIFVLWGRLAWNQDWRQTRHRFFIACRQAFVLSLISALFWWPGAVGPHAGLFTEEGGDVTIYAGLPAKLGDRPLWTIADTQRFFGSLTTFADPWAVPVEQLSPLTEPPFPGWSMQRIIELKFGQMYSGWYTLQHVLTRIPIGSFDTSYLAVLALIWVILIAIPVQLIFLWRGLRWAIVAFCVFAAAHAISAVGYNHAYPQLLAMCFIMLLLGTILLPRAAALSPLTVLILFLFISAVVAVVYYPALPLLFIAGIAGLVYHRSLIIRDAYQEWKSLILRRKILLAATSLVVAFFLWVFIWSGIHFTLGLVTGLANHSAGLASTWGNPLPYDQTVGAALFGGYALISFPIEPSSVVPLAQMLIPVAGIVLLGVMYVRLVGDIVSRHLGKLPWDDEFRIQLGLELGLLAILTVEYFLGRSYYYAQYKAASYAAPFVLFVIVTAMPPVAQNQTISLESVGRLSLAPLLILVVSLAYFRVLNGMLIVNEQLHSAILEMDFYSILAEIGQRDNNALVLSYANSSSLGSIALWDFGLREGPHNFLVKHYRTYPSPREHYLASATPDHYWVLRQVPPQDDPTDVINLGRYWAYRPMSSPVCWVEAAPYGQSLTSQPFSLGSSATQMLWWGKDMQYYVFPRGHGDFTLFLKVWTETAEDNEVVVEVLSPSAATLHLNIDSHQGPDIIATLNASALTLGTGRLADFYVLQIPGGWYSNIACQQ